MGNVLAAIVSIANTVEPLYKGHHWGMKFWPLVALTQGFFSKTFQTQKNTLNGMKVGAMPTQAKADTVERCCLFRVPTDLYIQRLKTILEASYHQH